MKDATFNPNFIDVFADYLGNAERLPFVVPEYAVEKPQISRPAARAAVKQNKRLIFNVDRGGSAFGWISVSPQNVFGDDGQNSKQRSKTFVIWDVHAANFALSQGSTNSGVGRELVRRAVLYADNHGYNQVRTSSFLEGAATFWFGLGFRHAPSDTLHLNWGHAGNLIHEAPQWQAKLKASPDSLWEFAQTELARRVLRENDNIGVLDLKDPVQRNYAFSRLKLDSGYPPP